jgi:DNA repair exonuclease SbcCD nuclease subunit
VTLEGAPTVRIWGRGFAAGGRADQRPLSKEALATVREAVNASNKEGSPKVEVAVLHASREGFCPPGQKVTAPFSDAEIYDSPFAYVALGHYHARSELPGDGKRSSGVRAAYAGSTVSLDLVELAAHGVLAVSVEHGSGTPQVKLEFSELDKRRAHDIPVDITGCPHTDAIERRIFRGLEESRVRYEDLVTVRLAGRLPQGIRYEPSHELEQRVFYVKVDRRRLRPDHDLASYRGDGPGRTTEERFARAMLGKLDKEKDGERRALIESALYYGLDALKRQGIVPCYEDLGE